MASIATSLPVDPSVHPAASGYYGLIAIPTVAWAEQHNAPSGDPLLPLPTAPERAGLSTSGTFMPVPGPSTPTAIPDRGQLLLGNHWRSLSRQPNPRPPELVLGNLAPPG